MQELNNPYEGLITILERNVTYLDTITIHCILTTVVKGSLNDSSVQSST